MAFPTKIATCCHCGKRALLVADTTRHCLTCDGCGAPLTVLKSMPVARTGRPVDHRTQAPDFSSLQESQRKNHKKPNKSKPRKGLFQRLAEEAFDLIEDVFD